MNIIIKTNSEPRKEPSKLKCFWWKIERKWQNICDFFNPKNKWFYQDIPNSYRDLDELLKIVLFKSLVSYVEVEKGLEHSDWSEGDGPMYKQLIESCYKSIKVTIPQFQKLMDETDIYDKEQWKIYSDASDMHDHLEQLTCETIVRIRGVLWT
jgi:hypothetical protein